MGRRLILYDGECGFCSRLVAFVVARDPGARFSFAAIQSKTGQGILLKAGLPLGDLDTLVLAEGGRLLTKSSAALRIVAGLSGLWPLLRILSIVPAPLRDAVYDFVARNRYRILRGQDHCLLPGAVADRMYDSAILPERTQDGVE